MIKEDVRSDLAELIQRPCGVAARNDRADPWCNGLLLDTLTGFDTTGVDAGDASTLSTIPRRRRYARWSGRRPLCADPECPRYFYPRIAPGGYLTVHDYSSKAVDEYFAGKPEPLIPLPDGAGSMVIRKMRPRDPTAHWLMQKRAEFVPDWTFLGTAPTRNREYRGVTDRTVLENWPDLRPARRPSA